MKWQDTALTIIGGVFSLTLLPTILDPSARVPYDTSIMTALALAFETWVFWTLKLKWSATTAGTTAVGWTLVAILRGGGWRFF